MTDHRHQTPHGYTKAWDPLVRISHWGLAAAFFSALLTQASNYELHLNAGYALLAVVVIRTAWGFVGSQHARFRDFIYSPGTVIQHLHSLAEPSVARRYIGHNPAGGAMILLLLACLTVIAISGIMLDAAENRSGPLQGLQLFFYTDILSQLHVASTHISLGLVVMHVLGVAVMSVIHQENLVIAMLTGKKRSG